MWERFVFLLNRLGERLWIRPLISCVISVAAAFVAKAADRLSIISGTPNISPESIDSLLSITAGSMLVIATLAVASMVSAFASASSTATPRSFSLLVSDDTSQNALSAFLGTFIFSFVALIALKNSFYGQNGLFVLSVMTVAVLAFVIVTFLRWVDWIARLGRVGTTIKQVESVGLKALSRRRLNPQLCGATIKSESGDSVPVYAHTVGYVQHINVAALQSVAAENKLRITVCALPGTFTTLDQALARVSADDTAEPPSDLSCVANAFEVGSGRAYDDDPRFALIALSEIASRALSPAVNDPGTAISIFGSFIRMFGGWAKPLEEDEQKDVQFERVLVPELSADDMLDDAFRAIARDGAGIVEVQVRLQKTLRAIAAMPNTALANAATEQSRAAVERAEKAITFKKDMELINAAADWSL